MLVVDLAGHISNFNRRFAALWELPDEMLLLHADDEIFDWMRQRVADPAAYMRRLSQIDAEQQLRSTDVIALRSGAVVERRTLPQLSRGRAIGRVFSYRHVAAEPAATVETGAPAVAAHRAPIATRRPPRACVLDKAARSRAR